MVAEARLSADGATDAAGAASRPLPALRLEADGRRRVDLRAVIGLAWPMFLNSAVMVLLNLTDTWFVAHISTDATAAMGAIYFLAMVFLLLLGGVGMGVQTLVAQAWGANDAAGAARVTWAALWVSLATLPLFWIIGDLGPLLISQFGLEPGITQQAIRFWSPRLHGGTLATLLYVFTSYFNGIGRPRVTLVIMILTALGNVVFNALLIHGLGMGIAGSAMATNLAQGLGALTGLCAFLNPAMAGAASTPVRWRAQRIDCLRVLAVGIPTGLFPAVDVIGWALFQIMMARLGAVDGASTQLVMMLTSLSYLPAIGIGLAGTTLVGQSIGAGDPGWAMKLGTRIVGLAALYMGGLGVLFALFGGPLLRLCIDPTTADAAATLALSRQLLWVAAGYQLFDAINLASAFCLRGAGDVKAPTVFLLLASWLVFMPLAHILAFAPGQGYVHFLPALGWGATGGWIAALCYVVLLAVILFARWRSVAWKAIRL